MDKLDELLKLEKAANLVCKKYDRMASTYERQFNFDRMNEIEHIEYAELQMKYKKSNKIHSKIIDDIETFLDEHFKEG